MARPAARSRIRSCATLTTLCAALFLAAAGAGLLSACGGGEEETTVADTSNESTDSGTDSGSGSSSDGSGDDASVTVGDWTIATGANADDLHESLDFARVAIALDTMAVTSGSSLLSVSTASDGSAQVMMSDSAVLSVATDSLGVTISADFPSGTLPEIALSGSYGSTVTVYSSGAFKLSLEGVAIASADGPAINIQSKQRAYVVLADGSANTLSDTSSYSARTLADGSSMDLKAAFFSEGPVIVSGGGALAVTSAAKHALASDKHFRLRAGTLTLAATKKDGLRANDAVVIDGGTLAVTTPAGKGIKVEGKEDTSTPLGFIAINDGTIDITSYDKAITASWESDEDGETATLDDDPDPRVTINGGTITIATTGTPYETASDSLSPEGIEAKSVLTINGGTIVINSTDDALNAGTGLAINGGRVYAKSSSNDAVDSNGYLTISGGIVVADGSSGAEGGLDCDENTFAITGGTVVGFGGRNSTPTRSATTQNTVLLTSQQARLLVLRDSSGALPFAFTLPRAASAVLLSAPGITTGKSYTLVGGGTLGGYGEDFHGLYLDPTTHSGGTTLRSFTVSSTVTQL